MRLVLAALLALGACSTHAPETAGAEDLALGVAFPPVADAEERAFTLAQLDALGVRHVRLGQRWAFREPERDRFVWGPLEARVSALADAGVEVFLTLDLKGMPDWLGALPPDEQEAEFRAYVRELLARVGGGVAAVQFGNEWTVEVDRYAGGDVAAFVRWSNVLYDEVQRLPPDGRPEVVLGSVPIGGLHTLALLQGRIENVVFEGGPQYTPEEVAAARRDGPATLAAFGAVFGGVRYDAVDLHLYDDVWNWPAYREAVEQVLREAGRDPGGVAFVASEFGGPHPTLEPGGEAFRADRVREYVRTLDRMGIERAYFFKLVEERGADIAHPNSFLLDADLRRTAAFDALAAGR
ncbi:beta-galactosidase [Rubrivirga sp. S365]|uniref:Beta-galactosidase n=1 Tax=Rubrivirga litoralis TaxID=3075598 RepID=A0ABU3BMT8_9BACT|nr:MULTISPECIES: beta-galactosidase [unclassified Rubrivirga]MDT0630614.1 beta-galactosidase [Rubrivirga sp. F394]MDT7857673.1 beta-galactosidase [Rubrivirga sp. S365]